MCHRLMVWFIVALFTGSHSRLHHRAPGTGCPWLSPGRRGAEGCWG